MTLTFIEPSRMDLSEAFAQGNIQAHGCKSNIRKYNDGGDDDDDDDDDEEGWEECMDTDCMQMECLCLFCSDRLSSPEAVFIHCREKHQFDIYKIHKQFHLDCFSYIKMINYIRKLHPEPRSLIEKSSDSKPLWHSDDFMKPVLEDDGLLQFDIEDLSVDSSDACVDGHCSGDNSLDMTLKAGDARLVYELKAAQERANQAEQRLQLVMADLAKMRTVANEMISSPLPMVPPTDQAIQHLKEGEDDSYFESYGHFSIHQEMLQDKIRTESYRDAICSNPELFRDKVVLDVGCGTGILSMFAAQAGAKLVIGVEMSDIIYQAMDIIRENGLEDKVKLVKGRMEEVDLPVEKVDVIISEWMGYFLLFECMLDTVLWARDHYLSEGGVLLPDRCTLFLAAVDDKEMYNKNYEFWNDVYGFKMSCMKKAIQNEASVICLNSSVVLSEPCIVKEIDTSSCCTKDLEFTAPFSITAQRDGDITAVMGYFDVEFTKGQKKIHFSTSPFKTQTHWKQTVFLLDNPVPIREGQTIEGQLSCKKNYKDPRSLIIYITLVDKTYKYNMQ